MIYSLTGRFYFNPAQLFFNGALQKKIRVDSENRAFNPEWTVSFQKRGNSSLSSLYFIFLKLSTLFEHAQFSHFIYFLLFWNAALLLFSKWENIIHIGSRTYKFSSMLLDNKYCQKVFKLSWIHLIWQSGIEYMQVLIQLLGYLNIYHIK